MASTRVTEGFEALLRSLVREESRSGHAASTERLVCEIRMLREELSKLVEAAPGERSRFLTVEEAAEISRHSADTIRMWVKKGRLSRCGTSRKLLVREDALRNLLTANCPAAENVIDMQQRVRELLGEE